jgi:hypothetical protein
LLELGYDQVKEKTEIHNNPKSLYYQKTEPTKTHESDNTAIPSESEDFSLKQYRSPIHITRPRVNSFSREVS